MLKKLLKYDVAAVWKIWLPVAISVIGTAFAMSLMVRAILETNVLNATAGFFLGAMMIFLIMATVIVWALLLIATPLLCYIRYYNNFFSDQGYLTFTLPVKRSHLYLSKVINALIWSVGNAVVTVISLLIIALILPPPDVSGQIFNLAIFEGIGELFKVLWEGVGAWTLLYILEVLVLMLGLSLYSIGMFHMCITLGSVIAKKHKVLTAVGLYLGISFGLSFITRLFTLFFGSPITGFFSLVGKLSDGRACAAIAAALLFLILIEAVLTAVYHLVTLQFIERKLNLA